MVSGRKINGLWWFRVFGYGIHWKDTRKHPPLASERLGLRNGLQIGYWRFRLLKREDTKRYETP